MTKRESAQLQGSSLSLKMNQKCSGPEQSMQQLKDSKKQWRNWRNRFCDKTNKFIVSYLFVSQNLTIVSKLKVTPPLKNGRQ